jgi:hypothetical protein
MIITDKFVYVHHPKTGGSFVNSVLRQLYHVENNVPRESRYGEFAWRRKHRPCRKIPEEHRGKMVLATVRNPYDWWVSAYEFGWWRRKESMEYYRGLPGFNERFPTYPDLGFADYLEAVNETWRTPEEDDTYSIGPLTDQFIRFYFKNPPEVRKKLDEEYFRSGRYKADMFDVHFIRTDRLNQELYEFLAAQGYPPDQLSFIMQLKRVLPELPPEGRRRAVQQRWQDYYTPDLKRFVQRRELPLFTLFPEFDV